MRGEWLARASLALEAAYCATVGALLIVFRVRLGSLSQLPAGLVAMAGAATVGWAMVVLGQTVRVDWRTGIKQTVAANVAASTLLAVGAAVHPTCGARALLAFTALDVMALAVAQVMALAKRRG
jgi:hypothetical protein